MSSLWISLYSLCAVIVRTTALRHIYKMNINFHSSITIIIILISHKVSLLYVVQHHRETQALSSHQPVRHVGISGRKIYSKLPLATSDDNFLSAKTKIILQPFLTFILHSHYSKNPQIYPFPWSWYSRGHYSHLISTLSLFNSSARVTF